MASSSSAIFLVIMTATAVFGHEQASPSLGGSASGDYMMDSTWPADASIFSRLALVVSSVAVDHINNEVWIAQKNLDQHPIMVLDGTTGEYKRGWGKGSGLTPHALRLQFSPDGKKLAIVWIGTMTDHTLRSYTPDGQVITIIGTPNQAGSSLAPLQFYVAADIALTDQFMYVSDGERFPNARVVKIDAKSYKTIWSAGVSQGNGTNQFEDPHGFDYDGKQYLYVADRYNNRLQIVHGGTGSFVGQWNGTSGACAAMGNPWSVRVAFGQLFIADGDTNRLTRWLLPNSTYSSSSPSSASSLHQLRSTIARGSGNSNEIAPTDCVLLQTLSIRGDGAHQMGVDSVTGAVYVASVKPPSYVTRRRGQAVAVDDESLLPTGHDGHTYGINDTTGKSSRARGIARVLTALIIIGAAATGGYFIYKSTTKSSSDDPAPSPVPHDLMPHDVADTILASMNTKVDPCDDYYEYACGTWRSKEPAHAGPGPYVRSFNILAARLYKEKTAILNEDSMIQSFINTCVDETAIQSLGYKPLTPFWKVINSITHGDGGKSFWRAMGTLQRSGQAEDAMIGFGVDSIDLVFRMLLVGLPASALILDRPSANETAIYNVLKVLQANGMTDVPVDQLRHVAIEYLRFEMDFFNNVLRGEFGMQEGNVSMVAPATVAEWGVDIPSWIIGLSDTTPIGGSPDPLLHVDRVYVSYVDFWHRLGAFIKGVFDATAPTYSVAAVKTYFQIHLIVNNLDTLPEELTNAWHSSSSSSSSSLLYSMRRDKHFHVTKPQPQPLLHRWTVRAGGIIDASSLINDELIGGADRVAQCQQIALAYYIDRIDQRWADKYLPSNYKNLSASLVDRIYRGMGEQLRDVYWLDNATLAAVIDKWKDMKVNIAYDNDWDTYSDVTITNDLLHNLANLASHRHMRLELSLLDTPVNRNHFPLRSDILIPNAFYSTPFNSINMLAGMIAEPFFGHRLPDVLNLAALGAVTGHEITHAFDNHGRLYNGTGFKVDWWTPTGTAGLHEHTQCLVDQYNTFPVEHFNGTLYVNGNQTLNENMADLAGFHVAWSVYKNQSAMDQLMPVSRVHNITNDELFWLYAAQTWCAVSTPEQAAWQYANGVHSPAKDRVNGAFSNIVWFAQTYQCSALSNMGRSRTPKKCTIW